MSMWQSIGGWKGCGVLAISFGIAIAASYVVDPATARIIGLFSGGLGAAGALYIGTKQ